MTTSEIPVPLAAAPLSDVPRWARVAAHAVPFVTLPAALWRVALVAGLPVTADIELLWWEVPYILGLSLVTEGLALLTLGLVQPWGEILPRWVPLLAGRRIPSFAVTLPAALGAVSLTLLWGFTFRNALTGSFLEAFDGAAQKTLVVACYTPLLAWGPLLAAVTIAYHRRRRA